MYPYNFKPKNPFINDRLIFIAMPFAKEYEFIFTNIIKKAIDKVNKMKSLPDGEGYFPWRAKDINLTRTGWIDILNRIWESRLVIGVLTGGNPNVFYELGIIHVTQQISRQILLAEKGFKPKFDLKDIITTTYNRSNLNDSVDDLSNNILDMLKYYDYENDLTIQLAQSKLDYYDFEIILKFGKRSHFTIHDSLPSRLKKGISLLAKSRLLRLSLKKVSNTDFEFSFYWTDLGNALLKQLEIINEEQFIKRKKDYHKFFNI